MDRSERVEARAKQVADAVRRLYRTVAELEALFPGRRFTPDGHLVGSIGEALARDLYDLELFAASAEGHDAEAADGTLVQIKATQRNRVSLYSEPEHLIVLGLGEDGHAEEIYNGPGALAWEAAGKRQKNGQRPISVSKLRALMDEVPQESRLPTVVPT